MDDPMNQVDRNQQVTGDVARLSIVVRTQVEDESTPRVWLLYEHEGRRLAVATSADNPYKLIRETEMPALTNADVVRVKDLGADERVRFEDAMQRVSEVSDAGLEIWTPLRTSEAFAAGIWETTVGEKLAHSVFARSTPQTLARSISAANVRDSGLSQDNQERIGLELSPRQRRQRHDSADQDQSQHRGRSL